MIEVSWENINNQYKASTKRSSQRKKNKEKFMEKKAYVLVWRGNLNQEKIVLIYISKKKLKLQEGS